MQTQVQQSWLDNHNDRMTSPESYTYYQEEFLGKKVPTAKLNKIWRKYHEQQLQDVLVSTCKAAGCVAVRSTILTKREKTKHSDRQCLMTQKSYYLFPVNDVPLNIFVRLRAQEGKVVYEKNDAIL